MADSEAGCSIFISAASAQGAANIFLPTDSADEPIRIRQENIRYFIMVIKRL